MSNLLNAIINIVNSSSRDVHEIYKSHIRANNMGDALEGYLKDAFCNTFDVNDEVERLEKYSQVFSYLGNQNNPPDIMIKGGDAIEVKKVEHISSIALNSSYPKNKLFVNSPMITSQCRNCEVWETKDIIYAVGVVSSNKLTHLCFVYGEDYAADHTTYERISRVIKDGIKTIPDVEFSDSKELGRVNRVDPLGITYLRIRGMWGIENPFNVFNYVYARKNNGFEMFAIINNGKYYSFPADDRIKVEQHPKLLVSDCKIKDPNNPVILKNAKLICLK